MMLSSLTCARLTAWTVAAVALQILGLSLFVIGFFPVKPTLGGFSGPESYQMPTCNLTSEGKESELLPDQLSSLYKEMSKIPPSYDRLIVMVIDGLPAEFVIGRDGKPLDKAMIEAMPYTQSLLTDGRATAYHAKAAPPTVTMPRIKAMVSGAIGGFLDVALNFNTQAFLDDNLLDQFYRIGWKMVMLGDETWIKLFPKLFARQDGVSSFYVKDTVEVDFNVSRHLDVELAAEDWDLLILHYLGLDHVGHIGGRQSILMAPKLKEMDEVIKMIHMRNILHQDNTTSRTLLVVVSDHGMTDGGNHGGSSYEETDSLALFIGLGAKGSDYSTYAQNVAFQVDIAPTLALLFGVPIPKNNIGVVLTKMLDSWTDEQRLRALELNAWQLLRLLQAHLPGLLCGDLKCIGDERNLQTNGSIGSVKETFCHLISKAMASHNLWQLRRGSGVVSNADDLRIAVESYYDFLRSASDWLSRKATDKPINLLLSGIAIMLVSCFLLLVLLFFLLKEFYFTQAVSYSQQKKSCRSCHIDEVFVFIGVIIHFLSFMSSSMVEEEQYTWHFLTSTLYLLFLFIAIQPLFERQSLKKREEELAPHQLCISDASSNPMITNENYKISSVLLVLICGRILRCWHQGGVNWVHLPDVSKLLLQAGSFSIKVLHLSSLLIVMILSSFALGAVRLKRVLVLLVSLSHFVSGFLVLLHIMESQSNNMVLMKQSTSIAQICFVTIGSTVMLTVVASPWVIPIPCQEAHMMSQTSLNCHSTNKRSDFLLLGFQDCTYLIGTTCVASWCLLQLLLQQPINAIPVLLIFLQLLACIFYFSTDGSHRKQWVEVAAIYFLGMAGHFGLGNSNSLATIDVAGAFIGISSHSTVLSGILMFMITYASQMLSFLSMVMYVSMKNMRYLPQSKKSKWSCMLEMKLAFPCLLPLVLNSFVLIAFTIILLIMRNHLFVWSVFSPKYLYICAATVCVYIGVFIIAATGFYTSTVLSFRTKRLKPKVHNF